MEDLPETKLKESKYQGECIIFRLTLASFARDTFLVIDLTTKNITELPYARYQPKVLENA